MRSKPFVLFLAAAALVSFCYFSCNHKHVEIASLSKSTSVNAEPTGSSLCGSNVITASLLDGGASAGDGIEVEFVLDPEDGGMIIPESTTTVNGVALALLELDGSADRVTVTAVPGDDYPGSQTSVVLLDLVSVCNNCTFETVTFIDCSIDYPEADGTIVDMSLGSALASLTRNCSLLDDGSTVILSCDFSPFVLPARTGDVLCIKFVPTNMRRYSIDDFSAFCLFMDEDYNEVTSECVAGCL